MLAVADGPCPLQSRGSGVHESGREDQPRVVGGLQQRRDRFEIAVLPGRITRSKEGTASPAPVLGNVTWRAAFR